MPIADENKVREILTRFTRETIPDYIIENATAILEADGVQKLDIQQRDKFLDVDGQVQGEDFQIYTSELGLNLTDGTINSYCNCPESFSGVCRHVGATALKLLKSL
jgi:non-specific serine/threonine protein kinase